MIGFILQGLGYGFAAAAQPGPFQTYVISQTLRNGWRRTLPAALAPLISDGPIIALALLLLRQVPAWLERGLHIASGMLILYLAWSAYVGWRRFNADALPSERPASRGLLEAALMNVLSPGPWLFWTLVAGPVLLAGWRESPAYGIVFLVAFYAAMIATLSGLIVLFGTARHLGPRVTRALLGASAIALAFFGLYQLWRGVAS